MSNINIKSLMNRLIELTLPNNHRIEAIKAADAKAKETIETVKSENKDLTNELKTNEEKIVEINANIEGILKLKDVLVPSAKEYINVLEANPNIPFNINAITAACKSVVDENNRTIDEITTNNSSIKNKIEQNDEKKAIAKLAIKDAESNLYQEEQYRNAISALIEKSISENGRTLAKERIEDELRDYYGDLFNEDEMETICKILQYPKEGLVEEMRLFEGQSKSTTDMVREAMEHSEDDKNNDVISWDSPQKINQVSNNIMNHSKESSENKDKLNETREIKRITNDLKTDIKDKSEIENFIKNELGVTDEDIKFNPQIKQKSKKEIIDMIERIKQLGIDPKSVNLRTYCGNFRQFINNIETIRMSNYDVNSQLVAKHAYLGDIPTDMVFNNLAIINKCGYNLVKVNGKLALPVITRNSDKLYSAICLISELDADYFQNPENMAKKVANTAGRIYYCLQKGINYKDDNFQLVENAQEFESYYGENIDSSFIPQAKECNQAILDYVDNSEVVQALIELYRVGSYLNGANLTTDTIGRFNEICTHISDLNESDKNNIIEIGGCKFLAARTYTNIRYILSKGIEASDRDIIVASLMYGSHNSANKVSEIGYKFNPNSVTLKVA